VPFIYACLCVVFGGNPLTYAHDEETKALQGKTLLWQTRFSLSLFMLSHEKSFDVLRKNVEREVCV